MSSVFHWRPATLKGKVLALNAPNDFRVVLAALTGGYETDSSFSLDIGMERALFALSKVTSNPGNDRQAWLDLTDAVRIYGSIIVEVEIIC